MSRYTHAQRMKLPPFYDYSRARFFARARKDRDDAAFVVLDDELQARGLSAEALPRGGVVFASDVSALSRWDRRLARLVAEEPTSIVVGGDNPVPVDGEKLELPVRMRGAGGRVRLPLPRGGGLFVQNLDDRDSPPARARGGRGRAAVARRGPPDAAVGQAPLRRRGEGEGARGGGRPRRVARVLLHV